MQKKIMAFNQDNFECKILSKSGEKLYLKPEIADVYFTFETNDESERIPAHKIILASGSDVFNAMFYGSLKETGDINIVDVSADGFKAFLRFFYFNNIKLTMNTIAEVMYLGKKYDVAECLEVCADFLASKLIVENAISIYGLAICYDQSQLQELCESKIRLNSKEILESPSFSECDRDVVGHIMKMDYLSCTEVEVFNAVKVIKCNRFISNFFGRRYYTKSMEATTFSTSTPLLFGYFIFYPLYGRHNDDITKNLKISTAIVSDSTHTEAKFSNYVVFNNGPYVVKLPKPIIVKPGTMYEIRISLPDNQYYLVRALKTIVSLESDITIEFHNVPVVKGTVTGIVYELGFNLLE